MTTLPFSVVSLQGLTLSKSGEEEIVTLNDELILAIASTVYQNHHVGTLLRILIPQITGRGFSIELDFRGASFEVTDPLEHATLYNFWEPLSPRIIQQVASYGLVVINLLRREHLPPPYHVLPQVMDLASEVYVKMYVQPNKERSYRAFLRQRSITNLPTKEIELPSALVFVVNPPTFDGQVDSIMQQALELCARMDGMAARRELQDIRATLKERIYYQDPQKDAVMDTNMTINSANAPDSMPLLPGYAMTDGLLPRDYVPPSAGIVKGQLEHRELVLERGNGFQERQHRRMAEQLNGAVPDQLTKRYFNPQLNRLSTLPMLNFWTPEKILPQYERLEHGTDFTFVNSQYVGEYDLVLRNLASRFGVPFEWVIGSKIGLTSEVDMAMKQFDVTVKSWQKTLEKVYAHVYLAIHGNEYIEEVQGRFTEEALRRSKSKKRVAPEEAEPEAKRQKSDEAEVDETPEDAEAKKPAEEKHERFFLSEQDLELLKASINITVHFNENPVITQEVINQFEERNYITREAAMDLSFRLAGLPESYKATDEQLAEDAKLRKKLETLATPDPVEGKQPAPKKASDS